MEQIKAIALAFILVLSTPVYSDTFVIVQDGCANVVPIKKGDPAPCNGFYFPDNAEKEAAQAKKDAEYFSDLADAYQKKSELQTDENNVLEQRLKLYMDTTQNLSKDLAQRDNTDSLYRFLYFGLGIVVTGVIVNRVGH